MRDDSLQPIPIIYNGYHTRSLLEARWLVWMDLMGFRFEYEPEALILSNGTKYLPDLYLPDVGFWAEIKPSRLSPNQASKCALLGKDSGRDCLLLVGPPDFTTYTAITWNVDEYIPLSFILDIHGLGERLFAREKKLRTYDAPVVQSDFSDRYREAVCGARSARFDRAA